MSDSCMTRSQKPAGLLEAAVFKLFTRGARVVDIEDIGGAFRIVTLGGEALRKVDWTPGDKIQIQLGGWTQRTYTPMGWDPENGRTRILVYLHGDGPGTRWARALRIDDECVVFGPRKSVRLARPQATIILFGDETSLGLAAALRDQMSAPTVLGLFEVSSRADTAGAVERLDLNRAGLCPIVADDGHFGQLRCYIWHDGQRPAGSAPKPPAVIPAKRESIGQRHIGSAWIPAFAGMTGFGRERARSNLS